MTVLLTTYGPVDALPAVAGAVAAGGNTSRIFTIGQGDVTDTGSVNHLVGRADHPEIARAILDAADEATNGNEVLVVATEGATSHDPMAFTRNLRLASKVGAEVIVVADGECMGQTDCVNVASDVALAAKDGHVVLRSIVLVGGHGPAPKLDGVPVFRLAAPTACDVVRTASKEALHGVTGRDVPMSPERFEHLLISRGRQANAHIVLCEGADDRILIAADECLARRVAKLTILGDVATILERAEDLGLDLSNADLIDPKRSELRPQLVDALVEARKAKGMTVEQAEKLISEVTWFGTLMVHTGLADGMVSGAIHTTAETIRPALQVVKTAPGMKSVSAAFLMALADRVLVFADCAVTPNPDAENLASIAAQSAQTAAAFGIDPRVAILSYSTGSSGSGADVDRAVEATRLTREANPGLALDGPLQFDAAFDPVVAASKAPDSPVAGKATVFIFPDLESGNVTYKAVQRTAGAVAIGPLLQGLNKPVNDLSRGCTVTDIVNTVAMTAVQAGQTR